MLGAAGFAEVFSVGIGEQRPQEHARVRTLRNNRTLAKLAAISFTLVRGASGRSARQPVTLSLQELV